MTEKIAMFLVRFRGWMALAIAVATIFFGWRLKGLQFSADTDADLPADDPEVAYFRKFREHFGGGELLIVALDGEIFRPASLLYIRKLTSLLAGVSHVKEVVSIANVPSFSEDAGRVTASPLLEQIPDTERELRELKKHALETPEWVGHVISADGRTAGLTLLLDVPSDQPLARLRIVEEVEALLSATPPPELAVYMTGVAPLLTDFQRLVRRDFKKLLWMTPLLIFLLLLIMFRSWRGAMVPLTVVAVAVVWTLGLLTLLGKSVSMIMVMVPTLIAVIGISDVIHLMTHYYERTAEEPDGDRRSALVKVMDRMLGACFLTSLTTAVGFGSLALSRQKTVHELGIVTAIGIMTTYVLAMSLAPVLLSWLPLPRVDTGGGRRMRRDWVTGMLNRAGRAADNARGRRVVLGAAGLIFCVSLVGAARLKVETQISAFLPETAPSVRGMSFLQGRMAGFGTLDMAVEGETGVFRDPEAVRGLERLQRFLDTFPEVEKSFSLADLIKAVHRVRGEGGEELAAVPDDRALITEYLLLLSMSDRADVLESFVSGGRDMARITARAHSLSTTRQLEILEAIEDFSRTSLPPGLTLRTTGMPKLYAARVSALVNSQLVSLVFTFLTISLLLVAYLRSLSMGLMSMIPNLLPVMTTLALMGFSGISLNVSTLMISCIAIGIAVDDTIHFLVRYKREVREGRPMREAGLRTLQRSGRAMVFTSVVIAGGFSILAASSFAPNRYFGLLTAATMISALAADLLLLPALIFAFRLKS